MTPYDARYIVISNFVSSIPVRIQEVIDSAGAADDATNPKGLSIEEIQALNYAKESVIWSQDEVIIKSPSYRVTIQLDTDTESSFSGGISRRYIYSGYVEIQCVDTNRLGERVLFAMADAAEKSLENKRLTYEGVEGSVGMFTARRGALTNTEGSENLEITIPLEFADRR